MVGALWRARPLSRECQRRLTSDQQVGSPPPVSSRGKIDSYLALRSRSLLKKAWRGLWSIKGKEQDKCLLIMLPWVQREAGNRTHMLRIGNPQVSERAPNCITIITPPPIVQGANQFWNLSCVLGNPWVAAKHPDLSRSKSAYQPFRAARHSLLQKARVPARWRKSSQAAFCFILIRSILGLLSDVWPFIMVASKGTLN